MTFMLRAIVTTLFFAVTLCGFSHRATAQSHSRGRVLVVLSSAHELTLRDGRHYPTGFYLNEFAVPVQALIQAGYEPVFADPQGNAVTWDAHSASARYFGGSEKALQNTIQFVEGLDSLKHPRTLASVRVEGSSMYVGIVVPGGHAPLEDLMTDPDLGEILRAFHNDGKTTGLICHGPVALASSLPNARGFHAALVAGNTNDIRRLAAGWPYTGYHMTVFSTPEEQFAETHQLKGHVLFYPATALADAGAMVEEAQIWTPNIVTDRELITAQQPFSDKEFSVALVKALDSQTNNHGVSSLR
ncbi:type 1 glutamine amidotransferase domain-containing protein [Gluconobacter sp. R75690]|nr:type 1 glutamine amidotransferase domain-containing protein [Gluconobacter sp. R75690]MBF0879660.1 type 1 glutamine amidotransferase domain-containing protein [Gluconobacter sp. R75828]